MNKHVKKTVLGLCYVLSIFFALLIGMVRLSPIKNGSDSNLPDCNYLKMDRYKCEDISGNRSSSNCSGNYNVALTATNMENNKYFKNYTEENPDDYDCGEKNGCRVQKDRIVHDGSASTGCIEK